MLLLLMLLLLMLLLLMLLLMLCGVATKAGREKERRREAIQLP